MQQNNEFDKIYMKFRFSDNIVKFCINNIIGSKIEIIIPQICAQLKFAIWQHFC